MGDDVTDLAAGDRVTTEPKVLRRRREYCKGGEYHLRKELVFMTTHPRDGALDKYVT